MEQASALLGPARTGGGRGQDIRGNKYAPWRVLVVLGDSAVRFAGCSDFCPPRRHSEASSASADGSGLALSERSEFSQTPAALSNAAYRRSRATNPARLSFAYFSLAKQRKVSRLPGRHPACSHSAYVCKSAMTLAQSGAQTDLQLPPGRNPARLRCATQPATPAGEKK